MVDGYTTWDDYVIQAKIKLDVRQDIKSNAGYIFRSEHMLTVTFPNTVELSIDGESQTIANLIGAYKDVVMADTELNLDLAPRVEGREIAGVTVNGEAIAEDSFDAAEYVYSAAMPNADTTIELGFTVVDKQNLRAAIEIAEAGRTKQRKPFRP